MRPPVSGPSFLGLGDERSRDLDYLLEDEPPRGHGTILPGPASAGRERRVAGLALAT